MKIKLAFLYLLLIASPGFAAISNVNVYTRDTLNNPRDKFSNTETISLDISCVNDTPVEKIKFKFEIRNPANSRVFTHIGNSSPGTIGMAGSQLTNLPMTFYSIPGMYTFYGEITTVDKSGTVLETAPLSTKFEITSANISLVYPPDGSQDVPTTPLMFNWVGSGASKYKIYIGDEPSFYRPLYTNTTIDTQFQYPDNPTDPKAKLTSGTLYYWKIEGLDSIGRIIAVTQIPFSFTVKAQNTRDLAITGILINTESDFDNFKLDVYVKNNGNQTESNIAVDISVSGSGITIPTQSIQTISPDTTKILAFNCGSIDEAVKMLTVSATLNMFDDNAKNNSLTKTINITPKKEAKILGKVSEKNNPAKGIDGATVEFTGPVNGTLITKDGGQYKIDHLRKMGSYTIKVTHPDYKTSETKTLILEEFKPYTNIDITMEPKAALKEMTFAQIWDKTAKLIKNNNILKELEGYKVESMEIDSGDIRDFVDLLEKNKITLIEVSFE